MHEAQAAFQESEYFKEKSKECYKIEAKNSELKRRHGYDVAYDRRYERRTKTRRLTHLCKKVGWDGENVHVYLFGSDDSGGLTETEENTIEPLCENSKCYT